MQLRDVFTENIVPLKAPVDSAGTAYATPYVNAEGANELTFYAYFGVVTAASADQNVVVTVEASTSTTSNATEVALPFDYRLSAATGGNSWGSLTTVANTGLSLDTTTVDGKMVAITIDLKNVEKLHGQRDAKYLRLVMGIDAGGTVTLNAVWAVILPTWSKVTVDSAT